MMLSNIRNPAARDQDDYFVFWLEFLKESKSQASGQQNARHPTKRYPTTSRV
jgi:hypothetical protein